MLLGLHPVRDLAQMVHLHLPRPGQHHRPYIVMAIPGTAYLDALLDQRHPLLDDRPHLHQVRLLHRIVHGQKTIPVQHRRQHPPRYRVRLQILLLPGNQEPPAARLRVLRQAHDLLHLADHLKRVLHPILAREQRLHRPERQPRVHPNDDDRP